MHPALLLNAYLKGAKKHFSTILGDKYPKHNEIVERIMGSLKTKKDVESFFSFVGELYEKGYLDCIEQYREKLEEHGLKVKIIPGDKK